MHRHSLINHALRWLALSLRLLLAAVFLWSGVTKGLQPRQFAEMVGAYGLLPELLWSPAAVLLIAAEIVAAITLIADRRSGLFLSGGLLLLFIAVLAYGIMIGLDIDCGCFGPGDPEAEAFHDLRGALLRDLAMLGAVACLACYRAANGPQTLKPAKSPAHTDGGAE